MNNERFLKQLLDSVRQHPEALRRLTGWERMIRWEIDGAARYWQSRRGELAMAEDGPEPDIVLRCSQAVLEKIASGSLPLFLALWATGELQFEGDFGDAFRLGYLFLNDRRGGRVLFLAHCFLNTNTRFPGGCAYPGATEPLIEFLLRSGVGLIQMPCPEFQCLGLEKELYGRVPEPELRAGFRTLAQSVADQIQAYREHHYEVLGILGMNPSPSCGVEIAKAKGSMIGRDRELGERAEPGVFIEELRRVLNERNLNSVPIYGFRRLLPHETGETAARLAGLGKQLHLK